MARYFTDFSGYAAGAAPSDWASYWQTADATWRVESVADATGGKALRLTGGSASNSNRALRWTAVPDAADVEILARLRTSTLANPGGGWRGAGVMLRASPSTSLTAGLTQDNDGQRTIVNLTSASSTGFIAAIASPPLAWQIGTWYWFRLRVSSPVSPATASTLRFRSWAGAITDEPGTWQYDADETGVTAAGVVGVWARRHGLTHEWDIFGVGTNGDTAPHQAGASLLLRRRRAAVRRLLAC